jgi:gamma-glutamyltranspeptidase/glutathione hydrolase
VGSPGGSAILSYNLKAMVGVFDWGLTMQQAINLPNMVARGDSFSADVEKFGPEMTAALQARGVAIKTGQNENLGPARRDRAAGRRAGRRGRSAREGVAKGL